MPAPILNLPGKVDANNALVVVVDNSGTVTTPTSGPMPIAQVQGKVDGSNQLVVHIV